MFSRWSNCCLGVSNHFQKHQKIKNHQLEKSIPRGMIARGWFVQSLYTNVFKTFEHHACEWKTHIPMGIKCVFSCFFFPLAGLPTGGELMFSWSGPSLLRPKSSVTAQFSSQCTGANTSRAVVSVTDSWGQCGTSAKAGLKPQNETNSKMVSHTWVGVWLGG